MRNKEPQKMKILFIIWSYTYGGGAESLLTMIVNHLNPEKYDISIIEYEHSNFKTEPVNHNIHILPPIEKVETVDHQKKGYQVYHTPEILIERYIKGDYDLYVSFNYQIPTFLLPAGAKILHGFMAMFTIWRWKMHGGNESSRTQPLTR